MKKTILLLLPIVIFATCLVNKGWAQINLNFSIKLIPDEPVVAERPPQPTPNHVWIEGEWVWKNGKYESRPGYWTVPEKDHIWEKGEWKHKPDGSAYWEPGKWKVIEHVGVANWLPEPSYQKPPRPSQQHLWVEGEWVWEGNNHYKYHPGYWTIPEPDNIYVSGHWAQWPGGEWYWVKGYWKKIPQNVFVSSVPAEPTFNRPPQPSAQHVWIDAEWIWKNNTFTYKPGYWMVRDPHKNWIKGYWHQRRSGGFYWISGHWSFV